MTVDQRLDAALRATAAITALDPCCLCGQSSDVVGVFMPNKDHAAEYGTPAGKNRLVFYPICAPCIQSPDAAQRVEAVLRRSSFRILRGTR
jgi:hypothetical protein